MERSETQKSQERVSSSLPVRLACAVGLSGVLLGAFGAHALKATLSQNGTASLWEKAVFYHLIHAVMLFILANRARRFTAPWICFAFGILCFSGSLYLMAVLKSHWLGPITPLGGLCFMAGWILLIINPEP